MTDREAIRRLATIVSELAYATGHSSFVDQAIAVFEGSDDLAEPAAPTDDNTPCEHGAMVCEICAYNRGHADGLAAARKLNAAPTVKEGDACRHGTVVNCSCEFGRGYDQARRDITADSLKAILHPTVTREQAERIRNLIHVEYGEKFNCPPYASNRWPAFFRAVSDALEGE